MKGLRDLFHNEYKQWSQVSIKDKADYLKRIKDLNQNQLYPIGEQDSL